MSNIKIIADAIEEDNSLRAVAETLSEIAAQKIKRIRSGILQNGAFLQEITAVYGIIKLVAAQRKLEMSKKAHQKSETTTARMASILITSNGRLYGNLDKAVINLFMQNALNKFAEKYVVGKTGIQFLRAAGFGPFAELVLHTDTPSFQEMRNLLNKIKGYDRILVYHPKFQSVISQIPFIKDVKEAVVEASLPKKRFDFILEPEIDKMIAFFDSQISALLLEQAFLETELARAGARLVAMDRAQGNAMDEMNALHKRLGIAKRSLENIRLLESLSTQFTIRKGLS